MNHRQPTAILAAFAVLVGAASFALAQQPASTPVPPPSTTPAPAPSASDPPAKDAPKESKGDDKAEPNEDTKPAEAPRKPAAATGSPQRFEPSEKVRPDFDVAFPVDI